MMKKNISDRQCRKFMFLLPLLFVTALVVFRGVAWGASESPFALLSQLAKVLVIVENEYVDVPLRSKLLDGAISGMISHLDPHSRYMNVEEYKAFIADTSGEFNGIGIEVDLRGEAIVVIAPILGSPADKAGLKSGDEIIGVDGLSTRSRSVEEVAKKMRGPAGQNVVLTVRRSGNNMPIHFTVQRANVKINSIQAANLKGGMTYLRVKQFQEHTYDEMMGALNSLYGENYRTKSKGILLDLRNNPGGIVEEAIKIADEFMDSGRILTTRARGKILEEVVAKPGGEFTKIPCVILINEWSASASEILAGALQDQHLAKLVGRQSFGKGSVQTVLSLPGGAGLKLTTARYYTSAGRSIQAVGIKPDLVVNGISSRDSFPVVNEGSLEGHLLGETSVFGEPPDQHMATKTKKTWGQTFDANPSVSPSNIDQKCGQVDQNKKNDDLNELSTIPPNTLSFDPTLGGDLELRAAYEMLLSEKSAP